MKQLKEGEVICSRCNGEECIERDRLWMSNNYMLCLKCGGTGKLDWVENIVGKKTKFVVKAKIIPLEPTIVFK